VLEDKAFIGSAGRSPRLRVVIRRFADDVELRRRMSRNTNPTRTASAIQRKAEAYKLRRSGMTNTPSRLSSVA
jgi:hypothetical protein